jgi:putative transposase
MGKTRAEHQEQPTIWALPDDVWPLIQTLLDEHYPATRQGPRRVDLRRVLHGSICRVRTGCPWHHLPACCGDDRTGHRPFQPWCQRGLLARLWAVLVETCEAVGGVDWPWQAADAAMGQARLGGDLVGAHPHGPGAKGVKRRLVVEAEGGPLGITIAGANRHATTRLAETLEAIVVERPEPTIERPQPRCLEKGYAHPTGHDTVAAYQSMPPMRRMGEDKLDPQGQKTYPARRWVVERTLAWLSKCRGLLVR